MALKFTSLPKSRHFNIVTRFYDPQKEAMKEREERFNREMEQSIDGKPVSHYGAAIKGSFRKAGKIKSKTLAEVRNKSKNRLIYIIIVLSILIYLVLK